jgi:peptide/nickel transport system permease protein
VRSNTKHKALGALRRLGILLLVVWTVVSLVTLLIELVPGDPAVAVLGEQATPEQFAQFRQKHGLDRPPFFFWFLGDANGSRHFRWYGTDNRYTDYWVGLLHGDLGSSFRNDCPVVEKHLLELRHPRTSWRGAFLKIFCLDALPRLIRRYRTISELTFFFHSATPQSSPC